MNIAITLEISYGERHWHVDDVVIVLIDREGLINTIAVVENEDDESWDSQVQMKLKN